MESLRAEKTSKSDDRPSQNKEKCASISTTENNIKKEYSYEDYRSETGNFVGASAGAI